MGRGSTAFTSRGSPVPGSQLGLHRRTQAGGGAADAVQATALAGTGSLAVKTTGVGAVFRDNDLHALTVFDDLSKQSAPTAFTPSHYHTSSSLHRTPHEETSFVADG